MDALERLAQSTFRGRAGVHLSGIGSQFDKGSGGESYSEEIFLISPPLPLENLLPCCAE